MLIKEITICKVVLMMWIAIWALFRLRPYLRLLRDSHLSIDRIEEDYRISVIIRNYGWMAILPVMLILSFCFADIAIVIHAPSAINSGRSTHFSVERYKVPFYYNGQFYSPGGYYVENHTSTDMVIYPVRYFCGKIAGPVDKDKTYRIPAWHQAWFKDSFEFRFEDPYDIIYYNAKQDNPSAVKWAIDTEEGAAEGIMYVNTVYERRQEMMNMFFSAQSDD